MYHNEFYFPTPAEVDGFYAAIADRDEQLFVDYCAQFLDYAYADYLLSSLDYGTAV